MQQPLADRDVSYSFRFFPFAQVKMVYKKMTFPKIPLPVSNLRQNAKKDR